MALSGYTLGWQLNFADVDALKWRLNIYDRDTAPSSVEQLRGTSNPIEVYYEGDEEFSKGIIGSECSIKLYTQPIATGGSNLTQFFAADEERFHVELDWFDGATWQPYWRGFLFQDEYIEEITSEPYVVELVAFDRVGVIDARLSDYYFYDDELLLSDIIQKFADNTALDLAIDYDDGGLEVRNSTGVGSYFETQKVSLQSFTEGGNQDEYVELMRLDEVVSKIMVSLNCRLYQAEGEWKVCPLKELRAIPNRDFKSHPTDLTLVNDDLIARHLYARKRTNLEYKVAPTNRFFNGSLERDSVGDTTPTNFTKTNNLNDSIEVSDEVIAQGSLQSLKVTASRISDSTFDNAPTIDKRNQYTVFRVDSSSDVRARLNLGASGFIGHVGFSFFVNNTFDKDFEVRYSIELERISDGDIKYLDLDTGTWETDFRYGFDNVRPSGKWEDRVLKFSFLPLENLNPTIVENYIIRFRIHTHNYDASLSDVEYFYDNVFCRIFNVAGNYRKGLTEGAEYYLAEESIDGTQASGQEIIELPCGIATTRVVISGGVILSNDLGLLSGNIRGQYVDVSTNEPQDVRKNGAQAPWIPLPSFILQERRESIDGVAKKVYSGTWSVKQGIADRSPLSFYSKVNANFTNPNVSDAAITAFTRFSFSVAENRYKLEGVSI